MMLFTQMAENRLLILMETFSCMRNKTKRGILMMLELGMTSFLLSIKMILWNVITSVKTCWL